MRAQATKSTMALAVMSMSVLLGFALVSSPTDSNLPNIRAAGSGVYSRDLLEPASPAENAIDTTSKSEVQREYLRRYEKNNIRPVTAVGVDLEKCNPGQAVRDGILPIVESWNFLRGLNGLNAVNLDGNGRIDPYTQAAAMVSARNKKLSHYPATEGFACATDDAARGARHSNLAQSVSQTSAETALWYYMDYSSPKKPTNDQLGHRLFMQDPQLALTSIGAAEGYTAISVRTGESYPGVSAEDQTNPDAPTPEWMSWPSAGFFPKQLLTSVGQSSDGPDQERWSFSVRNGDLSQASARVVDPDGNQIPVTVIRPNEPGVTFTPRKIANYSTLLIKFANIEDLPMGQDNKVYRVYVDGVKGTEKTSYEYQVVLFDPLTPLEKSAPTIQLMEQPLTGVGYKLINPIRMRVSAWPLPKFQWQQRIQGGAWEDIPGANKSEYIHEGTWTWKRAQQTEFRLVATSSEGQAISDPVRIAVQGLKKMPASTRVPIGSRAVFEASPILDPDGSLFDTTFEWQVYKNATWQRIFDDGHYSGTSTTRLIVNRASPGDTGSKFRLVIRSKIFKLVGYDVVVAWSDGSAQLEVY